MITLAAVQAESVKNIESNIFTINRISEQAADEGCSAVCFPEAFITGYYPDLALSLSVERSSPLLDPVSQIAKRLSIDILAGFMEREKDLFFITHAVFYSNGSRAFYRKTHLGQKESRIFTPGSSLDVFTLSCGIKTGFQLCVETHFPEITRTLSLKGAQVIFAPHAVPSAPAGREEIWKKYIPARSYDNRVYLACCNMSGDRFGGGSMATSPKGEIIASYFDNGEHLLVFRADPDIIARYHENNSDHRFRYYPQMLKKELCQ